MMEFAVKVEGVTAEDKALWVLAVDPVGERLLVAYDDNSLQWVAMADCTFAGAASPDKARPVVVLKPQRNTLDLSQLPPLPRQN